MERGYEEFLVVQRSPSGTDMPNARRAPGRKVPSQARDANSGELISQCLVREATGNEIKALRSREETEMAWKSVR